MPTEADRTPGTCSVITRSPPGSTVRLTSHPLSVRSRTRVLTLLTNESGLGGRVGLGGLGGRLGGVLLDRHQADLAALVDVGDPHAELVTDLDDVLDLADPLAVAQLRDVDEAVLARQQRDERAERGRLHHGAEEALA